MTTPGKLRSSGVRRLRVGLGAAVVLVLVGLGVAVLVSALGPSGVTQSVPVNATSSQLPNPRSTGSAREHAPSGSAAQIYVHVVGAVTREGLYALRDGDRVVDAIAAAGGFSQQADRSQLNLARVLSDGEQLVVPVIGAEPAPPGSASSSGGKVNLNTADLSTLETLPRVGPAMAKRIVDWRTSNGRFSSVEDLMSITGVGDKTFQQLKSLVTV